MCDLGCVSLHARASCPWLWVKPHQTLKRLINHIKYELHKPPWQRPLQQPRPPQISSYSFVFPAADGRASRYLLPLLDLLNHDGAAPAVRIERDAAAGAFQATALRSISAGEQITHRYVAAWVG